MTARDDAITAMADAAPRGIVVADERYYGRLLDAIPANVLTRLAVERIGPDITVSTGRDFTITHPHTHHETKADGDG